MNMDIPSVTPADLAAFQNRHFSPSTARDFPRNIVATTTTTGRHDVSSSSLLTDTDTGTEIRRVNDISDCVTNNDNYDDGKEDEDDGLGYYPDGVKRTLTDEQILMFRHSEEESIRREERHRLEALRQKKEDEDEEREMLAAAEEEEEASGRRTDLVEEADNSLSVEQQQQVAVDVDSSRFEEHNRVVGTTTEAAAVASHGLHTRSTDIQSERGRQGIARTDKNSGRTFLWPSITKS